MASAEIRICGGVLLEHDPATDRGSPSTPESIQRFYFLTSIVLIVKEAPLATRNDKLMLWAHATDVGNLLSIPRQRALRPTEHLWVYKDGELGARTREP